MGNCENMCAKAETERPAGASDDPLRDRLSAVIQHLETGRQEAGSDQRPDESMIEPAKSEPCVVDSREGKTVVQYENGGVYEGRLGLTRGLGPQAQAPWLRHAQMARRVGLHWPVAGGQGDRPGHSAPRGGRRLRGRVEGRQSQRPGDLHSRQRHAVPRPVERRQTARLRRRGLARQGDVYRLLL